MKKYDIHCHVLPGVDDGAADMEVTKQILSALYEQGVRMVIATPHFSLHSHDGKIERVQKAYKKTKVYVEENMPDMVILLGSEVYMEQGMLERIKTETTIALNGTRYVLCEFRFGGSYKDMYDMIQQLVRARYKPVLAHVERYACLREQWDRIRELREMGVLMQLNAESLSGNVFDKKYRYGKRLVKEGAIDFIGSDTHDMDKRAPQMERAERTLIKILGNEEAEKLLYKNAQIFEA